MAASTLAARHARLIEANRREYGEAYPRLTFLPSLGQAVAAARRNALLQDLAGQIEVGCGGTKLDMRALSPGCRICAEGDWSCLFINGRCNARCFYCPTRQDEIGLPTTNATTFRSPADYADYLAQFGFRGMSLSGGEPLLTPGRSLGFLSAAKRRCGDRLHTWLYTNGTLVDRDILLRLRDAGLDEIRFDIGAVGYSLNNLALAVGIIPTVTVEIPAVPEDLALMKQKMVEMAEVGVGHLNLHQLRLTPHSLERFAGRSYTYLHGERVTVLESELTALELVHYARTARLDLPVNYCSFVYKNRYQKAAARRRGASYLRTPLETVTPAGFLRSLSVSGEPRRLTDLETRLRSVGADAELWAPLPARQRLQIAAELCGRIDLRGLTLNAAYAETAIREQISYRHPFREVRLPSGRKLAVERAAMGEFALAGADRDRFVERYLRGTDARGPLPGDTAAAYHAFERLDEGLQDYF